MIKPLFLSCATVVLVVSTGCLFSKKSAKPKESSAIAGEVEETFKRRWVDKRITDLVGQGIGADAARIQASLEFNEKFAFTRAEKK
jgi:hypothetical protein